MMITNLPRFTSALILFLALCCALIVAPPRYGSHSGFAALIDKHARLEKLKSPKLVLVGGSNVALGVDSELLERLLRQPVQNMGFGCTVGLRYMLEEVKNDINAGDLVLIMPEYDFFCVTTNQESNARVNGSSELLNLIQVMPAASGWVFANYSSAPERIYDFLYDSRRLVMAKIEFYQRLCKKLSDPNYKSTGEKLFEPAPNMYDNRTSYNERGDVIVHLDKEPPGLNGMEVISYGKYSFNQEALDVLIKFAKFAHQHNVEVVIAPPPLPVRVYSKYKDRANDIFEHWRQIPYVKALGMPEQFAFPESYFFDTAYHLNKGGRQIRTRMLADELRLR